MTESHIRNILIDVILDRLDSADEATLERVYRELRPRSSHPPAMPAAEPEAPGTTRAVVVRALRQAGRPVRLGQLEKLVRREQPAISKGSLSGALSKLAATGEVRRVGPRRLREYSLTT